MLRLKIRLLAIYKRKGLTNLTNIEHLAILPNMKDLTIVSFKPSDKAHSTCCAPQAVLFPGAISGRKAASSARTSHNYILPALHYSTGAVETSIGPVPIVTSEWTPADRHNAIRCRLSRFRMHYTVPAGLYAIGRPDASSDIFVSANYKLSFDILRRSLAGIDGWILVLDTSGINVWCAAAEGTFSTEVLI